MEKMTIFYKTTSGKIVNISSGAQDYGIFQEAERVDAIENLCILQIDENQDILNNPRKYIIENNRAVLRPE